MIFLAKQKQKDFDMLKTQLRDVEKEKEKEREKVAADRNTKRAALAARNAPPKPQSRPTTPTARGREDGISRQGSKASSRPTTPTRSKAAEPEPKGRAKTPTRQTVARKRADGSPADVNVDLRDFDLDSIIVEEPPGSPEHNGVASSASSLSAITTTSTVGYNTARNRATEAALRHQVQNSGQGDVVYGIEISLLL